MNVMKLVNQRTVDKAYEKGLQDGVQNAVRVILFILAQYLGDKRGWKPESIFRALSWCHKTAEGINEGYTTFAELEESVGEEYGIVYEDGYFRLKDVKKDADA